MTAESGPRSVQWAPSGVALDGVPSEVMRLLASDDGQTFGYGYGPGWSVIFGSAQGDISLLPGQWVTRHPDGRIEVTDKRPTPPAITRKDGDRPTT